MGIRSLKTASISTGAKRSKAWDQVTTLGDFESIATYNGTGSSGVITFSSIPSTYKSLQIRAIVSNTNSGTGAGDDTIYTRFNGDTGANYSVHSMNGVLGAANNTSTVVKGSTGATSMDWWYAGASWQSANSSSTNAVSTYIIDIPDYASTTKNKAAKVMFGFEVNSTSTNTGVLLGVGEWYSTAAISSISFTVAANSFTTKTQYALYGIKG